MTTNHTLIDLGEIQVSKPKEFYYILSAGDHPITVTSISAGCSSCTVARLKKMTINAHESVHLDVTFTPKDLGFQTKMVHVNFTENGQTLKTTLKFTATVSK